MLEGLGAAHVFGLHPSHVPPPKHGPSSCQFSLLLPQHGIKHLPAPSSSLCCFLAQALVLMSLLVLLILPDAASFSS